MLLRSRKSLAPVDCDESQSASNGRAKKRRVLGDITNTSSSLQVKDDSKKPAVAKVAPPLVKYVPRPIRVIDPSLTDREYMKRASDDIDLRDLKNPALATCYVNEMYDNFAVLEKKFSPSATYMADQPWINDRMRTILINWLVDVHLKFKMVPETLFLTVNIIDRYLEISKIRRTKLQLVGVASLLLAAKYEEIFPPEVDELTYITDRAYIRTEVVEMESLIAQALDYNLTVPTIHSFLCRYLKAAHADRTMVRVTCYLAERSLQEYCMLQYCPSVIAATSVLIARKTLQRHAWSATLVKYTNYDEDDLVACTEAMGLYINELFPKHEAVKLKYFMPKFGEVSKLKMLM